MNRREFLRRTCAAGSAVPVAGALARLASQGDAAPGFRLVLPFNGVVLLATPALQQYRFVGTIPAGGSLQVPLAVPSLPPLVEARHLCLQGIFQDPTTRRWLSGPSTLVVLDSIF